MDLNTKRILLCGVSILAVAGFSAPASAQTQVLPQINVTDTRVFGGGITGTSTTTITAEEIARSPEQTLPAILSREPGIQVRNLFGGVNAARSVVDMRGFGAAAVSNTLVLVNGRRLHDLDQVGVDLASILSKASSGSKSRAATAVSSSMAMVRSVA
jgi:iron complex outermembrane receptor protein